MYLPITMIWKPLSGYETTHIASNLGQIKSLPRLTRNKSGQYQTKGKLLNYSKGRGAMFVSITINNKHHRHTVHSLIASTFHGPRPKNRLCRHLNGDFTNNAASNLQWGTHLENSQDMRDHGTLIRGSKHYNSKLGERDIKAIRLIKRIYSTTELSKLFNVSQATIAHIVTRRTWKHI